MAASRSCVLVAVGMRITAHPRTEPDVPHSGIRLPPRVGDGEALFWPRMSNTGRGKPAGDEPIERRPGEAILLAAPAEAPPPQPFDPTPEGGERLDVVGHGVIGKVASHDLPQPGALLVVRRVQAAAQDLFDLAQLGLQPVARVFRRRENLPFRVRPQMWVKPRKLKVSGLPSPRRSRLTAAKRPNSIRRVLSGCRLSAKLSNRCRRSVRNRTASAWYWKPATRSSA